ncbi:MAG: ATP-dependent DNA helicase [Eubacteriaceae bacterium]
MEQISISVRDLVQFVLRKGDIDFKYSGKKRANEGTKAHKLVQNSYGDDYISEVTISHIFEFDTISICLQGRIDGIIINQDEIIIDEIKSTRIDIGNLDEDYNELHWAQAKAYAFLYCLENGVQKISVQLTYYNIDTKQIKKIVKSYDIEQLKLYIEEFLLNEYCKWALTLSQWYKERNTSINGLRFPFSEYRKGQRKLTVAIYKNIKEKNKMFVNAPTGIGKTISTIYPAIKTIEDNIVEKVFYMTSKNTQKEVVEETLNKLYENGLMIKSLYITSKEKICFKDKQNCNPEYCEYAMGHFDKINAAIKDIFKTENIFNRKTIEFYSQKHKVCPFEFSLDLALWSEIIVCDYNYVFDPRVSLKRFSEEKGKFVYLIDEAHNLVDRSREMYSAKINKEEVLSRRRKLSKKHKLYKELSNINKALLTIKKQLIDEDYKIDTEKPEELIDQLKIFLYRTDSWLADNNTNEQMYQEILKFYFEVNNFIRISDFYGTNYKTCSYFENNDLTVKLFCIEASEFIKESVNNGISSTFFSATLLPLEYYMEVLGGDIKENYRMSLNSPFDKNKMQLMICNQISTTYKKRQESFESICNFLFHFINGNKGNYIIFFPSYEYLNNVYDSFINRYPNVNVIKQNTSMIDDERKKFIEKFDSDNNILAFAVLGGIFSEGIDLKGNKLIGTLIVSVGLPKIGIERNIIKDYYDKSNGKGYKYAYMYPGFNKVMQGAGRVIRTEDDKGVVLLIDERFTYKDYLFLYPEYWSNYKIVNSIDKMDKVLLDFWGK